MCLSCKVMMERAGGVWMVFRRNRIRSNSWGWGVLLLSLSAVLVAVCNQVSFQTSADSSVTIKCAHCGCNFVLISNIWLTAVTCSGTGGGVQVCCRAFSRQRLGFMHTCWNGVDCRGVQLFLGPFLSVMSHFIERITGILSAIKRCEEADRYRRLGWGGWTDLLGLYSEEGRRI
jgi:hypothetical protein